MVYLQTASFFLRIHKDKDLARAYRLKGDWAPAKTWMERAVRVAQASGTISDLARALIERAELEKALGNRDTAVSTLREALELLGQVGLDGWIQTVKRQLGDRK